MENAATQARFFGLEFRSSRALTAADRGFLRASAQLIVLIDRNAERLPTTPTAGIPRLQETSAPVVVHTVAEWQAAGNSRVRDAWVGAR